MMLMLIVNGTSHWGTWHNKVLGEARELNYKILYTNYQQNITNRYSRIKVDEGEPGWIRWSDILLVLYLVYKILQQFVSLLNVITSQYFMSHLGIYQSGKIGTHTTAFGITTATIWYHYIVQYQYFALRSIQESTLWLHLKQFIGHFSLNTQRILLVCGRLWSSGSVLLIAPTKSV